MFRNRADAGRILAGLLAPYGGKPDVVVLALPRGGVPVAYEVAAELGAPLDVFVVRKLGVPGHEELAMGAIASGGVVVLNQEVAARVPAEVMRRVVDQEAEELARREATYREGRPPVELSGRLVIVVDDGLATGSSMRAAVEALRAKGPAKVAVAVPCAPRETRDTLAAVVDEVMCAVVPPAFVAVGASYADFTQVTDAEVRALLRAGSGPNRPAE